MIRAGDSGPRPDDYRPEVELVLDFIQRVWNDRDLDKVDDFMISDLVLDDIDHRTVIRPEGYRRALLRMLRPFPTGQFAIRDVATNYSRAVRRPAHRRLLGVLPATTTAPPTSVR